MEDRSVETTVYSLGDRAPGPPDRRMGERHLTLFRVGAIVIDGPRELCLIKNVSGGGMMIRAYCAIPEGTRVAVELKHGSSVEGVVRWVQNDCIGITFDQPIDVVALLAASMEGPRPRMPRVEVDCIAQARQDGSIHRVRVHNVSQGGLMIETRAALAVGGDIVATLPGLPPEAGLVRWGERGLYGITFNRIIPLPALVSWLQSQRERLREAG